ncbi:MAG: hypothetical protein ACFB10_11775 [Salibacteraceae bacterium]
MDTSVCLPAGCVTVTLKPFSGALTQETGAKTIYPSTEILSYRRVPRPTASFNNWLLPDPFWSHIADHELSHRYWRE